MTTHDHPDTDPALPEDDFWGDQANWPAVPSAERADRAARRGRRGGGSSIGRWWDSLLGGGATADRSHGTTGSVPVIEADDQDPWDAPGATEDAWDFEAPPEPVRRPGVDPLLARFGGLAVIVTLAIPAVLALTSGSGNDQIRTATPPIIAAAAVPLAATLPAEPAASSTGAVVTSPSATPAPSAAAPAPTSSETIEPATTSNETTPRAALVAEPEPTQPESTEPATTVDACGAKYELAQGDYWIRIADSADVSLADLLAVNGATVDTFLVPGRSICLPVGASTPSPPPAPTTAAPTTTAPTSTTPAPSARRPAATSPTATAPTTTPTTTSPPAPAAVSASEAEAIIRSVWPDDLEDHAVEIAKRESNLRSNVKNYCCYGLFQIHWNAHRSWLSQIGVSSAAQLFDPTTNAQAAYTLYQRSGGFGPWGG